MQLCAAYYRVSTTQQEKTQTIESQKHRAPIDMQLRGLTLVREYEDNGESASSLHNRPGMLTLLADADKGIFDTVWVFDLDRFDRSTSSIDWAFIKETFRKNNIKVITPAQTLDFHNEDQEFMADILNRVAALERRKIRNRMVNGKRAKAQGGNWVGGNVPFGYYIDENMKFQIDETQGPIYLEMVKWTEEGITTREIAKRLTAVGLRTPLGKKEWPHSTVYTILKNKLYTGRYERWTKPTSKGQPDQLIVTAIPALITAERWTAVQEAMLSRKTLQDRHQKRQYLLSNLIYCTHCNCRRTGEYREGVIAVDKRVYSCSKHRMGITKCPNAFLPADKIEVAVWDTFTQYFKNEAPKVNTEIQSAISTRPTQTIMTLISQIAAKAKEIENIIDMGQEGVIKPSEVGRRMKQVEEQKAVLERNLATAKSQSTIQDRMVGFKTIAQLIQGHTEKLALFSFEEKREILREFFYNPGEWGIYYNPVDNTATLKTLVKLPTVKLPK